MDIHRLQFIGEIGGLVFNFFFIYLLIKYYKTFNNLEKCVLLSFITLTFIIEIYLLTSWNNGHEGHN